MSPQDELPLVSIITPSLNQERFIRPTIESVLSRDYRRLEYLVMDGGSIDETLDILRACGGRLIWRSAPDQGQADAVNSGFRPTEVEHLQGDATTARTRLGRKPKVSFRELIEMMVTADLERYQCSEKAVR